VCPEYNLLDYPAAKTNKQEETTTEAKKTTTEAKKQHIN